MAYANPCYTGCQTNESGRVGQKSQSCSRHFLFFYLFEGKYAQPMLVQNEVVFLNQNLCLPNLGSPVYVQGF